MNDTMEPRGSSLTGATLMGFAVGALVGAGIALLLAPDSGKRTRERLASTAQRWSRNAGRTMDQARDAVAELGTDAKSAIKAGQDAFQHDRAVRDSRAERRVSAKGEIGSEPDAMNHAGEAAVR